MAKTYTSKIELNVELDDNRIPEKLLWTAQDGGIVNEEAKAILLSVWDQKAQEALRIDLWTKDMMLDEMRHFFYQSIITMSDTYERATNDKEVAEEIREFGKKIGEKMLANSNK